MRLIFVIPILHRVPGLEMKVGEKVTPQKCKELIKVYAH